MNAYPKNKNTRVLRLLHALPSCYLASALPSSPKGTDCPNGVGGPCTMGLYGSGLANGPGPTGGYGLTCAGGAGASGGGPMGLGFGAVRGPYGLG